MNEVVFDTNLVIDYEKNNDNGQAIKSLIEEENEGKIKIHIPVIVASEKTVSGENIANFYRFKEYMEGLGFKNLELLKPMMYLGMCFLNFAILPKNKDSKIMVLARDIHNILFPGIEFDHKDYCEARGIDHKQSINPKWKNKIIDTLVLWSAVYYDKKILVTRDGNFHHNKDKIKNEWGVEIKSPEELLEEVQNE